MKTKWLLLPLWLGVVAPSTTLAQPGWPGEPPNPYSYTVTLPPQWSLIGNQLDFHRDSTVSNTLANILPSVPEGTVLLKFDNATKRFVRNQFHRGRWSQPGQTLGAWEGAAFFNPTRRALTLIFHGNPRYGGQLDLSAGLSLMSCPTVGCPPAFFDPVQPVGPPGPVPGLLQFNPQAGDIVWTLHCATGALMVHTFRDGDWDVKLVLRTGEAFLAHLQQPRTLSFSYSPPI